MLAIFGLLLWLAAPAGVAVLELDIEGGHEAASTIQKQFPRLVEEQLTAPPIRGDSLKSLALLFACTASDQACLGQIASSLGARYLLYGRIEPEKDLDRLRLYLFDAQGPAIVSSAEEVLASSADTEAVSRGVARLLAAPGLEDLRGAGAPLGEEPPGRARRFLLPALFATGAVGLGLAAELSLASFKGDGELAAGEQRTVQALAVASDVCLGLGGLTLVLALRRGEVKATAALRPNGASVALSF